VARLSRSAPVVQRNGDDPNLERFIQADTLIPAPSSPQSWNRYAYANNSPIKFTDPSGHAFEEGTGGGGIPEEVRNNYWNSAVLQITSHCLEQRIAGTTLSWNVSRIS